MWSGVEMSLAVSRRSRRQRGCSVVRDAGAEERPAALRVAARGTPTSHSLRSDRNRKDLPGVAAGAAPCPPVCMLISK